MYTKELFGNFLSLLLFIGIFFNIPVEYHRTAIFFLSGMIGSYVVTLALRYFTFKKISYFLEWIPANIFIAIIAYYYSNMALSIIFAGVSFRLIITAFAGLYTHFLIPVKKVTLTHTVSIITNALFVLGCALLFKIVYPEISNNAVIFLSILIYIFIMLNDKPIRNSVYMILILIYNRMHIFTPEVEKIKNVQTYEHIRIKLEQLSALWTGNKIKITLEKLANNTWLSSKLQEEKVDWSFDNPEIQFFWLSYIAENNYSKSFKDAVGQTLKYLENNGDVPSVVTEQRDAKAYKLGPFDEYQTYDILAQQSLIDHSLQVARIAISKHQGRSADLEKQILISLIHDLGKIYGHRHLSSYKTGAHPQSSIMILEMELDKVTVLPYIQEIKQVVLQHHSAGSIDKITLSKFKEYDSKARRDYIQEYISKEKQNQSKDTGNNAIDNKKIDNDIQNKEKNEDSEPVNTTDRVIVEQEPIQQPKQDTFIPSFLDKNKNDNNQEPVSTQTIQKTIAAETTTVSRKNIDVPVINSGSHGVSNALFLDINDNAGPDAFDLSTFMTADELISEFEPKVNVFKHGTFTAFTVNGDLVLLYTQEVIKTIRLIASRRAVTSISSLPDSQEYNQKLGMSATTLLRNAGYLHTEWIKESYFQAPFCITDENGHVQIQKAWYIPVRIEAFAQYGDYSEFDFRKQGRLLNFVKAEVPKKNS